MAQATCPDVPFIFVSATLGEELAIETLKRGATDYVLKQRLERLVPAVKRALREMEERVERKRAETALRELAAQLERRVVERTTELAKANESLRLASSLDYETTLASVAKLAVPFLADWCTVDIVEDNSRRVWSKTVGNREDKGDKGDKWDKEDEKDSSSQPTTYDHTHSTLEVVSAVGSFAAGGVEFTL
jgi:nitrate/nitrite-specific signal transduction histidine kinase